MRMHLLPHAIYQRATGSLSSLLGTSAQASDMPLSHPGAGRVRNGSGRPNGGGPQLRRSGPLDRFWNLRSGFIALEGLTMISYRTHIRWCRGVVELTIPSRIRARGCSYLAKLLSTLMVVCMQHDVSSCYATKWSLMRVQSGRASCTVGRMPYTPQVHPETSQLPPSRGAFQAFGA